jgi:hypothetical protein
MGYILDCFGGIIVLMKKIIIPLMLFFLSLISFSAGAFEWQCETQWNGVSFVLKRSEGSGRYYYLFLDQFKLLKYQELSRVHMNETLHDFSYTSNQFSIYLDKRSAKASLKFHQYSQETQSFHFYNCQQFSIQR